MRFKTSTPFARLLAALVVFAAGAAAAEHNYYIHFSSFAVPGGSAVTSVTSGAANGTVLTRPADACGVRFEAAYDFDWLLPNNLWWPTPSAPATDVYMPSSECGSGGIRIEPVYGYVPSDNEDQPDDDDPTNQPHDMAGMFLAEDAKLYWIDASGKKLIYKNVCYTCTGNLPKYNIGASGVGFGRLAEQLKSVKTLLAGPPDPGRLNIALSTADDSLQRVSYDVSIAVPQRRTRSMFQLEASVRSLENDSQARLSKALSLIRQCRASVERGELKAATVAINGALSSVQLAKAALGTAENWFE